MERSYGLGVVFDQMTRLKHASDGVIFTPVKLPYTPGTCEKLYVYRYCTFSQPNLDVY